MSSEQVLQDGLQAGLYVQLEWVGLLMVHLAPMRSNTQVLGKF
jgi:hypothetical protein